MAGALIGQTRHGAARIDHFQVFGERRTGTNFLHHVLESNFTIDGTTKYGWKHGFPTMPCIAESALIAVIVRDPFSWLSSLHNRPFAISHHGLGFSDFIRAEWYDEFVPKQFGHARWGYGGMTRASHVANQIDRHPLTGKRFANPLEMRTLKNRAFTGFLARECNAVVIDYDRLKEDPEAVLDALAAAFDLPRSGPTAVPDRVGASGKPGERVTREAISLDDRAFIVSSLDADFEAWLGYRLETEPLAS